MTPKSVTVRICSDPPATGNIPRCVPPLPSATGIAILDPSGDQPHGPRKPDHPRFAIVRTTEPSVAAMTSSVSGRLFPGLGATRTNASHLSSGESDAVLSTPSNNLRGAPPKIG